MTPFKKISCLFRNSLRVKNDYHLQKLCLRPCRRNHWRIFLKISKLSYRDIWLSRRDMFIWHYVLIMIDIHIVVSFHRFLEIVRSWKYADMPRLLQSNMIINSPAVNYHKQNCSARIISIYRTCRERCNYDNACDVSAYHIAMKW